MLPVTIRAKMVDEIENKLNRLQQYVPFIDFLLNLNKDKYKKFIDIRFWITSKKRYPIDVLDKVEQSLITQYKNLFLEDLDIPKYIKKIFNTHGEIKCFTVNLCSDDEDDGVKSDDSDDVKIVSVSFLPTETCKSEGQNICEASNTTAINNLKEETRTDITTTEQKCTQNSIEKCNVTTSLGKETLKLDAFAKELVVDAKGNEQIKCSKQNTNKTEETREDNDTQENDKVLNILEEKTTKTTATFNNNEGKCFEVSNDTSVLNEQKLFRRRQDFETSIADDEMQGLENMDIESLKKIFNNLIEYSGIDRTEVETCFKSNGRNDSFKFDQPKTNLLDHSHEEAHFSARSFQKDLLVNSTPSQFYPQFYGLNMKDPRIIKQIEKLQYMMRNQPQLCRTPAFNTSHFPVQPVMLNKGLQHVVANHAEQQIIKKPTCPATYKEHRLLKAQKEQKAQMEQVSANLKSPSVTNQIEEPVRDVNKSEAPNQIKETSDISKSQDEDQIKKTTNVENSQNLALHDQINNHNEASTAIQKSSKHCDIKKVLLSELEPYSNIIADVLRKGQNNQHKNQCALSKANNNRFIEMFKKSNNPENLNISNGETYLTNQDTDGEKLGESVLQNKPVKSLLDGNENTQNIKQNRKRFKSSKYAILDSSSNLKRSRTLSILSPSPSTSSPVPSVPAQTKSIEGPPEAQELNGLASEATPIVLLRRLTPSDIKKYIKPLVKCLPESSKVLHVKLVEDVDKTRRNNQCVPEKSVKGNTIKYKNTDSNMTSKNTSFCFLCKSKPTDLTNHYRRTHKTESYVARLSSANLTSLENISFAQKITGGTYIHPKYRVQCVFCDMVLEDKFINFYKHYSVHTGEYAFQCSYCKLEKPFEVDIKSHQYHSKTCRMGRLKYLYQYPPNMMVIYLHCCKICNFVQLNEANTFKHLRDHHDKRQEDSIFIRKYILTAINDGEAIEYTNSEQDSQDLHLTDDTITVTNEPILEDKVEYSNCDISTNNKYEILTTESSSDPTENTIDYQNKFACTSSTVAHNTQENLVLSEQTDFVELIKSEYNELNNLNELPHVMTENLTEKNSFIISKTNLTTPSNIYKTYPKYIQYFGLLKCMAADCWFSTNNRNEMQTHLLDHANSKYPPEGFLRCAYCHLNSGECATPATLIEHVLNKHQRSYFQCSYCCYRGNSSSHVLLHLERVHTEEKEKIIFKCGNYNIKEEMHEFEAPHPLLFENVEKLFCPHTGCTAKFYSLNWLKDHMSKEHRLQIDAAQFAQYACIFCSENFVNEYDIKFHLVLSHPDEIPYACKRVLKTNAEDDIVENLVFFAVELAQEDESFKLVNAKIEMDKATESIKHMEENLSESQTIQPSVISELPQELKPNLEQLITINQDCVKQLLLKLTLSTGISPDKLYHCPYTICGGFFSTFELWQHHMHIRHKCLICICPHCFDDNQNLHLEEFREHFKTHCRHLYGCFHCGETFASEQTARNHIAVSHIDVQNLRIEKVPLYFNHSFNILVKDDYQIEALNFLIELQGTLRKRYEYLEIMNDDAIKTQWIVPLTESWLERFPCFTKNLKCKTKCLCANCPFMTYNYEELFNHLKSVHRNEKNKFMCSKCDFQVQVNWDIIIDHIKLHLLNIYICCVCSFYHYDRQKLSDHINQEHRHRDVPILYLIRSIESIQASISIVFAEGRKNFSTTKSCFCCSDNSFDRYAVHMKKAHNVILKYFCEICNERINKLTESGQHFSNKHKEEVLKIRGEFATNCQLSVVSLSPLLLSVDAHRNRENYSSINPFIKQECESDSDVIMDDDDDIVIAEDLLACGLEKSTTPAPKVNCINLERLKPLVPEVIESNVLPSCPTGLVLQSEDYTPITIPSIRNTYANVNVYKTI